jgi:MFS family permease
VLITLASPQFLMTLDSSVMNVSIATVAKDVGTTVTGIQTAITLYTLVMASLMITGGKIGQIWGRRRAFAIGCVIYGCGSLLTALSQNLATLLIGWSLLEGIGAALIMPAVVALVASNFGRADRPRAYGLVASAGAIAVAAGPLIGGLFTTYASWRWVFVGEVLVVLIILALARRMDDTPAEKGARLDIVGTVLSALGLALVVFGVLRSGTWGLITPKPNAPELLGLSPVIWLIFLGGCVLAGFLAWERWRLYRGQAVLLDPAMLDNKLLRGGWSPSSSNTSSKRACSSRCLFSCRSRSDYPPSPPASSCSRCLSRCCSPQPACRRCSPTHPHAAWYASASCHSSPAWSS